MFFLEYYGPSALYHEVRESLQQELASTFRADPSTVCVRRIVTEGERDEAELWVELSSEEQLIRLGRGLAARLTEVVRARSELDVWVMYRVVPRSHAFLNGESRGRAATWRE